MRAYEARKIESDQIEKFLVDLSSSLGIRDSRRLWPKFLYHVTDAENLASIFNSGQLYSRNQASQLGLIEIDSANPSVIAQTRPEFLDFARFYFRPRTPTQHNTEGFRPAGSRKFQCKGIPVVLVVDSADVLTREGTRFTDGNAGARHVEVGEDLAFLSAIPFQEVFHDTSFSQDRRDEIVHRRQAELLVPDCLDLSTCLRYLVVRSEAEAETLRYLLEDNRGQYQIDYSRYLRVNNLSPQSTNYFFREWTFIERVSYLDTFLRFKMSTDSKTPGPFDVHLTLQSSSDGQIHFDRTAKIKLDRSLKVQVPPICTRSPFRVEMRLDGRIAFASIVDPNVSPLIHPK